jgi:single-strand DNA-binding protein
MHNTIVGIGHLVADPTSQSTSTGKSICRMRICISDTNSKNKCFIDLECWEKLGETCQQYLTKGRQIYFEGELASSTWKDKESVEKTKNFIRGSKVKFLSNGGAKKDGASQDEPTKEQQKTDSHHDLDEIPF